MCLECLLGKGDKAVAHSGDKDIGESGTLRGHHFDAKTWPHPAAHRFQCWNASGQTTNRVGTHTHPSADRLLKVFLNPQLHLNTPLTQPCPPDGQDPAPPIKGKTAEEEIQSCSLWNHDHNHRKLNKMR